MSKSIYSIPRRTSRILKLSKEHQLVSFYTTHTHTHTGKKNEELESLYATFKKYDLCCLCFLFFESTLLPCDLVIICQKYRQEALYMG